jgi:hypothetical protein
VDADESFELEQAYESPTTVIGGAPEAPTPAAAVQVVEEESFEMESPYGMASVADSAEAEAEPARIPLAAADEAFELDQPWASPATVIGAPPPAPVPAADAGDDVFVVAEIEEAATLPRTPPSPAAAPPAAPAAEAAGVATPTLAELYFNQGATERAIGVYQDVLRREPGNERARARLRELEALEQHLQAVAAPPTGGGGRRERLERTIARLEGLLQVVQAMRRG